MTNELLVMRQAILASETLFRTIIDTMPLLAWSARADGWIEFYNRGWYEYTGTTLPEMEGWGWESVHDPRELQRVKASWSHSIQSGKPFELSFPLRRADGVYRWFLTRAQPLRDDSGTIVRWIGTNTDIDDRMRAEAQLAESLNHERETAEFREMFIGILGHDLRNPLGSITMAAALLLRRGHLDEQDSKAVARIINGSQRMSRMIAQLLDLTRFRLGGGVQLQMAPSDLREIAQNVIEEFDAPTQLHVEGDVTGTWDRDRLAEVLSNLAGNAIQYATPGTVVSVRAKVDGEAAVVVEISNQGDPIPADVLPFIFEPFRRAKQQEKSTSGNLGLGLYIAHQIVLAHSGTLDARSAGGTTSFLMRLPRDTPVAP